MVSANGIEADPDKITAIVNLPAPSNVHDVRIFLGMVNHMGKFAEHLADKTKPLRDLMQKESQWIWGPPQEKAFQEIKSSLTKAPVLALYDPNRETKISADASSFGLGGVLLQKQDDESWRPVVFISREVRSDNGPQYASAEFTQFAKDWGFKHTTSSPRFQQANGEVERAVKTTKSLLKKEKDPTKGLLAYRSTPLACGHSPAELLMGRKIRTTVPPATFRTNLAPSWPDIDKLRQKEAESKDKLRTNFNQRHRSVPLEPLQPDTQVYIN